METRLVTLKLVLDHLGVDAAIETVDDRKRIQKAIYLGQRAGVDLGYRFGWYLMGPYSPALTRDYFSLAEGVATGDRSYTMHSLNPSAASSLSAILPLLEKPTEFPLAQEDWLELVASLDYLMRVNGKNLEQAKIELTAKKPRVSNFADLAHQRLGPVPLPN